MNFRKFLKVSLVFLLVFSWLFSGWPQFWLPQNSLLRTQTAMAATAGPNNPGTEAEAGVGGGCNDNSNWSTGGANDNDTTYTSISGNALDNGNVTDELRLSNFGFAITSSAIVGITVEVLGFVGTSGDTAAYQTVSLFTAPGSNRGDNKATGSLPTSDPVGTYQSFGGTTDDWYPTGTWTEAEIENSGFGVRFCFTAGGADVTVNIDHVRVTVTYTAVPTITSASDSPDPVTEGNDITFSVDWNDADSGEQVKAKICKTDSLTSQNCGGGFWATSTAFTTTDPEAVSYTTTNPDVGTQNYYAFVCDDDANCSASTSGTFVVDAAVTGAFDVYASSSYSFDSSLIVQFSSQSSTIAIAGALKVQDDRATTPGWTLNLSCNDWKTDTELKQMDCDGGGKDDNLGKMCPDPSVGALYAEVGSLTNVTKGALDCFASGVTAIDYITASNSNGHGTYWLTDTALGQFIPANPTSAVYTTTIIFTLQ